MTHPIRPLFDFPYGPLKTDRHEIRLIQLKAKTHEPNPSDCALCVDLIHAERGHCQPYMALSYAWGRNNDQAPLRIRGRQYYINKMVDAALRQLQEKDSDVFIWIDQICINQQDDVEKGNQVQQMKEIYSEAETIIVWLGPAENGSDRLLKHLGRMGTLIWSGDHRRVFAPYQTKDAIEAIEPAFHFLCERDYWKRLWIMQEYTVARRLKIACGNVMIWDWQLQAVFVFVNKLSINHQAGSAGGSDLDSIIRDMVRIYKTPAASFMEGVVTRRNRYWRQTDRDSDSLFQVLITTLVLEQDNNFPLATDPRDRIFSVLQLAKDTAEFSAFPNYTWTCARVYREAALTMLKQGHIDILAYCQFPRDSPGIPSWAPDWRMMIRSPCTGPPWVNDFSASGQTLSQQSVSSSSTGIVELQGIIIGSVRECESIWDPDWSKPLDHASAMEYLEHVRVMCEKSPTISEKSDREKGYSSWDSRRASQSNPFRTGVEDNERADNQTRTSIMDSIPGRDAW
ncbi:hypothetical protein FGADI_12121 [Fusarium gaditjirri]|uniref:Heterokaryon incompatibility domain-containing protein n=1 Tax=Fusarium gaditjirri TaxID=282569 RepID=A0A8H4STE5_9HYPO|nr:hypothetical protein FGADI_12121 [Fusarium gaditjirri]